MAAAIAELLRIDLVDNFLNLTADYCQLFTTKEGILMSAILLLICTFTVSERHPPSGQSPLTSLCNPSEKVT